MIVNIPARLLTPVLPALLRAVEDAEKAATDRDLRQRDRDQAEQDANALNELDNLLRAALDAQPYTVAELAVRESEASLPAADCDPVTGQEYGLGGA